MGLVLVHLLVPTSWDNVLPCLFLRNRLKDSLTGSEGKKICTQQFIKIKCTGRTDSPLRCFREDQPDKTEENFYLTCDTKCCFAVLPFAPEEAKYQLCKVRMILVCMKGIPHLVTHDACTICCPDSLIKVKDATQINLDMGTPNRAAKQSNGWKNL